MGLLKRKGEKSETISVRIPASVKAELEELRKRADAEGFDLTATITETLTRLLKQVRTELDGRAGKNSALKRNGRATDTSSAAMSDGRAA
jgi:hypothetical protein